MSDNEKVNKNVIIRLRRMHALISTVFNAGAHVIISKTVFFSLRTGINYRFRYDYVDIFDTVGKNWTEIGRYCGHKVCNYSSGTFRKLHAILIGNDFCYIEPKS